jgi:hypothetical protein
MVLPIEKARFPPILGTARSPPSRNAEHASLGSLDDVSLNPRARPRPAASLAGLRQWFWPRPNLSSRKSAECARRPDWPVGFCHPYPLGLTGLGTRPRSPQATRSTKSLRWSRGGCAGDPLRRPTRNGPPHWEKHHRHRQSLPDSAQVRRGRDRPPANAAPRRRGRRLPPGCHHPTSLTVAHPRRADDERIPALAVHLGCPHQHAAKIRAPAARTPAARANPNRRHTTRPAPARRADRKSTRSQRAAGSPSPYSLTYVVSASRQIAKGRPRPQPGQNQQKTTATSAPTRTR